MNDFDTTVKSLVNAAVDRELTGHRAAPPFELPARTGHGRAGGWAAPLLAASVAALVAGGSVLAIEHGRADRPAGPLGSAPAPSPSVSQSVYSDQQQAARDFADAVSGAREATEVAGVTVGPISESDAARFENSALWQPLTLLPAKPQPGRSYPVTVRYVVGYATDKDGQSPSPGVTVVSGVLRDVAAGGCPAPFLARPGHTYLISCHATPRAGAVGAATFTSRQPTGFTSASLNLTDPEGTPAPGSDLNEAARAFSEALVGAPEAGMVAGISDRVAAAGEIGQSESIGTLDGSVVRPEPGRSYPMRMIYLPGSTAPAVAVLSIRFEDVAAAHCPGPFRIRAGHAYQIDCQVTFRPGAQGRVYFSARGPQGVSGPSGFALSSS